MSDTMDDLLDCRERLRKVEDELREARNTNALAAESRVEKAHSVLRIAYDALGYAFLPEKKESIVTARSLIRAHLSAALSSEDATRPTGNKE